MVTIPPEEVSFHPGSIGGDAAGRVFEWRGELLRGIGEASAADMRRLLESGAPERLRVVATEVTDYALDGYPLVLRHRRIPFVSYPFEWCGPMLKDAGLAVLDLNLGLLREGFVTKDPSPWNVVFEGTVPVYVDIGGIQRAELVAPSHAAWVERIRSFFVNPLRLIAGGDRRIVRLLQLDVEHGVSTEEFRRLGFRPVEVARAEGSRVVRGLRRRAGLTPAPVDWQRTIEGLRAELAAIDVPIPRTKWSSYYDVSLSPNSPTEDGLSAKHQNVRAVLERLGPGSVTDIGSSTGWFAKLAIELGARVVVLEADESAVSRLYEDVKGSGSPLLPLVMDFRNPPTAYGLAGTRVAGAGDRFGADLVMMLAVVHHVVVGQGMDFDQVADTLALFAHRHLLVEFVGPDDPTLRGYYPAGVPGWYTLEAFRSALERHFTILEQLPSHPESRTLLLGERR